MSTAQLRHELLEGRHMEAKPTQDQVRHGRHEELHFRVGDMPPLFGDTAAALIVDDDDQVAASLVRLLAREGYRCTSASDAAEARRVLATRPFALALVDVFMPGESGLELTDDI